MLKAMNKIERMQAMLQGERPDRVPAGFWFHFPAANAAGHAMAQAHIDYYRAADPDLLKVMNDNGYERVGVEAITSPADWRKLEPAPQSSAAYEAQLSGLRELVDTLGDEVLMATTIFNPYATGNKISDGKVTEHLKADPESVSAGLATIAESLAGFAAACIEAGAAGIYFSAQGGDGDRFTAQEHASYIKPHDVAVLEAATAAGATCNVLHVCGRGLRLEDYRDYPGHTVNWAPQNDNPSLSAGRELFQRPIIGGVDERGPIVDGPRDAIAAEVRAALADMGSAGFMVGAGCTVPNDITVQHLVWAREAVAE
jgi:uroporphyrinogen decarboxylase